MKSKLSIVAMAAGLACICAGLIYFSVQLRARTASEPDLRIKAVAHQWWWEFDYPSLGVRTSNVLYLPSTRDVRLELSSGDVIHSFWILGMKHSIDVVPGQTRAIDLSIKSSGELYGNCDSGCGCATACMRFRVLAKAPLEFAQWVATERARPADFKPPHSIAAPACATGPAEDHRARDSSPNTRLQRLLDQG